MSSRTLLLFGKLLQSNLHVNCHVNGTTFQSGLRLQTGLSSLLVSCKRALKQFVRTDTRDHNLIIVLNKKYASGELLSFKNFIYKGKCGTFTK